MNPMTRALGVVLAINTQVAGMIALAFILEGYLNENFPLDFSWRKILMPTALLGIVHGYYIMLRYLFRMEKERKNNEDS
ncbi:MAG: hypothetical protein AB8G05_06600 [Oligoflexales bacterium]